MMQRLGILTLIFLFLSQPVLADKAMLAGGCFWCTEADFEQLDGVINVVSGYTGGTVQNPTHEQVVKGDTGHFEAVEIEFDSSRISYASLLEFFWRNIDPFDKRGQFCDKGGSYRAAIFPLDAGQQRVAEASLARLKESLDNEQAIAVQIIPASTFYPAEDYHQNYYKNNRLRYETYRRRCGRDLRLQDIWGKTDL